MLGLMWDPQFWSRNQCGVHIGGTKNEPLEFGLLNLYQHRGEPGCRIAPEKRSIRGVQVYHPDWGSSYGAEMLWAPLGQTAPFCMKFVGLLRGRHGRIVSTQNIRSQPEMLWESFVSSPAMSFLCNSRVPLVQQRPHQSGQRNHDH